MHGSHAIEQLLRLHLTNLILLAGPQAAPTRGRGMVNLIAGDRPEARQLLVPGIREERQLS